MMVTTPISAEIENLFRKVRDLKAQISGIASQMPVFHRTVRHEIAQHTGAIPPLASAGPREDVLQVAIELQYQQMRLEEVRNQRLREQQSIMQRTLRDLQRQQVADIDTKLLNPEMGEFLLRGIEEEDDATQLRPAVKAPSIPLQWKCKRAYNEKVKDHFKRCARTYREMYGIEPQCIVVTPEDNNELILTLHDARFPRREQGNLEAAYMTAEGFL